MSKGFEGLPALPDALNEVLTAGWHDAEMRPALEPYFSEAQMREYAVLHARQLAEQRAELLEALQNANAFIEGLQDDLHKRRVADWYPEGANNAALQMSEDMRLLGNACANFDTTAADAIANATQQRNATGGEG